MQENFTFDQHLNDAKMMLDQNQSEAFIKSHLLSRGADTNTISEILIRLKSFRNAKRTQTGIMLILLGITLMGTGFITCILLLESGTALNFALYGLTSIGITSLILGLIMIFH